MIDVKQIIEKLVQQGITVYLQQGKLHAAMTKLGNLDGELAAASEHKNEITAALQQADWAFESFEPASPSQTGIWVMQMAYPGAAFYNVYFLAELEPAVKESKLQLAFNYLINRHSALRCQFINGPKGLQQRARKYWYFNFKQHQLAPFDSQPLVEQAQQLARAPFSLSDDLLIRGHVLNGQQGKRWVLLTVHHIACDFWSFSILNNELHQIIAAHQNGETLELPDVQGRYQQLMTAEDQFASSQSGQRSERFWLDYLRGDNRPLSLPDYSVSKISRFDGAVQSVPISSKLSQGLREYCSRHQVTPFVFCMTVFQRLLKAYTGQDCQILSPMAGRDRDASASVVGNLVYPVIFRTASQNGDDFTQALKRVNGDLGQFMSHPWYDFGKLVNDLRVPTQPGRMPLAQASFVWHQKPKQAHQDFLWREVVVQAGQLDAVNELLVTVQDNGENLVCYWTYNSHVYSEEAICKLAEQFTVMLNSVLIPKKKQTQYLPLTTTQQALLLASDLRPTSSENSFGYRLSFNGKLDFERLQRAIVLVALTNDSMMLKLVRDGVDEPNLHYDQNCTHRLERLVVPTDASFDDFCLQWVRMPFKPTGEAYFRYGLIENESGSHLLISGYHLVFDAKSFSDHADSLCRAYDEPDSVVKGRSTLHLLRRFALDQRAATDSDKTIKRWREMAEPYKPPQLLGRGVRDNVQRRTAEGRIEAEQLARVYALCSARGLSLSQYLRGLFAFTLGYLQEQQQGFYLFDYRGEKQINEIPLTGCFYKRTPILVDSSDELTTDWMLRFNKQYSQQRLAGELSIEQQNRVLASAGNLFSFNFYPMQSARNVAGGTAQLEFFTPQGINSNDLVVRVDELGIRLSLSYRPCDLPDDRFIERMLHFSKLLLQHQSARCQQGLLATEHPLVYQSIGSPRVVDMVACLRGNAAANPKQVVIIDGDIEWSFERFNNRVNQYAHFLKGQGLGKGDSLLIDLPASGEFLLWLWACIKAEVTYIPLDYHYPVERKQVILEQSKASYVVSCSGECETQRLNVYSAKQQLDVLPTTEPDYEYDGERLIYAIFTSGSTGTPKGAAVSVQSFANMLDWYSEVSEFNCDSKILLVSSVGFDLTQKNLFAPFVYGATLVIPGFKHYDPVALSRCVAQYKITHINCAPSAFYPLLDAAQSDNRLDSIRLLMLGGESINYSRLSEFLSRSGCQLYNSYGPTECTDVVCYHKVAPGDDGVIGVAVRGNVVTVLSPDLEPIPPGCAGEIFILGYSVGAGYINSVELTNRAFTTVNWLGRTYRAYATGDLGYVNKNGQLCFIGRRDHQVKLRGNRIELGEIEQTLMLADGAALAGAWVEEGRLLAVVQVTGGVDCRLALSRQLDEVLAQNLPSYMKPDELMLLDDLPLNAHGKLDRSQLPEVYRRQNPARQSTTEISIKELNKQQQLMASWWAELIKLAVITPQTHFFRSGGNSLAAASLLVYLNRHSGREYSYQDLFDNPSLAEMAELLTIPTAERSGLDELGDISVLGDISELEF